MSASPSPSAQALVSADNRPPGVLWRHEVVETVDAGLGYFLQRVRVEPALEQGRFTGFRIVELLPYNWWSGVDLRPGDVVTLVNQLPIERETQAYKAFETLRTAPELRVTLLREGVPRDLVFKIQQQPGVAPAAPATPAAKPEPKDAKPQTSSNPTPASGHVGFGVPRASRSSL